MSVYSYKAFKADGKNEAGVIDADSPKDARIKLRAKQLHVTTLEEVRGGNIPGQGRAFGIKIRGRKANLQALAMMTSQMGTLLKSGIPLMGCLSAVIEQAEDKTLHVVLMDVRERVAQGSSFSDSLATHPTYFSELYVNMVRAGEASGKLDSVMFRIAAYLHAQHRVRAKVVAALTYPAMMGAIGVLVVSGLMTFVVPKILDALKKSGKKALPLPTEILQMISGFLSSYWWLILAAVICLVALWKQWVRTPGGRMEWDGFVLKIPAIGPLLRKAAVSRFCVTFSTLLESGLPVLDSLLVVKRVVGNAVLEKTLDDVRTKISEGADIATPLKQSRVFPPVVGYMIAVGEESGQLEDMLKRIAVNYDEEVEIAAQRMTSLMEPIMIIVMAAVVGFVVLAVLLPILEMGNI